MITETQAREHLKADLSSYEKRANNRMLGEAIVQFLFIPIEGRGAVLSEDGVISFGELGEAVSDMVFSVFGVGKGGGE